MHIPAFQALRAANRPLSAHSHPADAVQPDLLVAGATGTLGNAVLRRLVGTQRFSTAFVLAREEIKPGLKGVLPVAMPAMALAQWPLVVASVGIIMFDPPRLFHERERALWTPEPAQLPELALWMQRCGVSTLAIVLPHEQGRLPQALKQGLANLDEQSVAALGFEKLLLIRSARKVASLQQTGLAQKIAHWMLSICKLMIPASEQPVRAVKVAHLVDEALQALPKGIHIAAPELVWRAAQGDVRLVVLDWLGSGETRLTAESRG